MQIFHNFSDSFILKTVICRVKSHRSKLFWLYIIFCFSLFNIKQHVLWLLAVNIKNYEPRNQRTSAVHSSCQTTISSCFSSSSWVQQPNMGQGCLIVEVYRSQQFIVTAAYFDPFYMVIIRKCCSKNMWPMFAFVSLWWLAIFSGIKICTFTQSLVLLSSCFCFYSLEILI